LDLPSPPLLAAFFLSSREHDAHEFLVYLLEGLHEDLNRVREKKKRYIDSSDQVETIRWDDVTNANLWYFPGVRTECFSTVRSGPLFLLESKKRMYTYTLT